MSYNKNISNLQTIFYSSFILSLDFHHNHCTIIQRQNKFSYPNKIKKCNHQKINLNNFRQIIKSLIHKSFDNREDAIQISDLILSKIFQNKDSMNQSISSMLIKISYKAHTIDVLTSFKEIKKDIIEEMTSKKNPFYQIIFQIWYPYIFNKLGNSQFSNSAKFKRWFVVQLSSFKEFIANCIYYLFSQWFDHLQSKKTKIYSQLLKIIVPQLITSHKKWKAIYGQIIRHLGDNKLQIPKPLTLNNFQIDPNFKCVQMQIPYEHTIKALNEFQEEFSINRKIQKLKQLPKIFKNQIFNYQQKMISEKKMKNHSQIDVDNTVSCFTYCLLKTQTKATSQALDYLELFFYDKDFGYSQYMEELGIGHLFASLKSGIQYLKHRNGQIEWNVVNLDELII